VKLLLRWLPAAVLLGLPALAAGYAFTSMTADGTSKQNQSSGQPIIWNIPQQSFTFNFNLNNNGPDYNASAVSAMEEWNRVKTSLQYQRGTNGAQTCATDGFNSAGWSTVTCSKQNFGDALAVTQRTFNKIGDTWYLSEADIALNQARNWQIYTGALNPNVQDFHRVILHELGHALGLDHPDDAGQNVVAIMNSHTSDIYTLQADDKNGIAYLYSGNSTTTSNSANQSGGSSSGSGGGGGDFAILLLAALFLRRESSSPIRQATPLPGEW
jgi:hypothetical protein